MNTLTGYTTQVRSRLDESSAIFYQAADITAWINEAIEDICSRSQILQSLSTSIGLAIGTSSYALPNDLLLVTRAEAVIAGATTPLYRIDRRLADLRFGSSAAQGVPQYFNIFGTPGQTTGADAAKITVFPTPSAAGTLNLYYERIPVALAAGTDTSLIPPGWDRLVVIYTVAQALMKDRDYAGSEKLQQQYEAGLKEMITNSRIWSSESEFTDQGGRHRGGIVQADAVASPSMRGQ